MNFTECLFINAEEIWDEYLNHPFIKEIGLGNLDKEKFKQYLIQDYLYLKEYAKVFCIGITKAKSTKEMKFFYEAIKGIMEDETAVHIKYLRNFKIEPEYADKEKLTLINESYTSYMQSIALKGNLKEIAVAILPCTWSYNFIGNYLYKNYKKGIDQNFYKDWIEVYSAKDFDDFTLQWIDYTNDLCKNLSEFEKENLIEIFMKCSKFELEFWNMAYNKTS